MCAARATTRVGKPLSAVGDAMGRRRRRADVVVALVAALARGATAREYPATICARDAGAATSSARARDDARATCENAHVDARRVVDDRGRACAWYEVDSVTGCCSTTTTAARYACDGCDESARCCRDYETCAACCQGPTHDVEAAMKRHARGRNQIATGFFEDAFEYCKSRCRTQPSVTFHENTYAYDTAYCYGDYPVNEDPVPAKGKKTFAGDSADES